MLSAGGPEDSDYHPGGLLADRIAVVASMTTPLYTSPRPLVATLLVLVARVY